MNELKIMLKILPDLNNLAGFLCFCTNMVKV